MQSLPATAQQDRHRPYSSLTEAEKWDWHANVYAFRRVFLEVSEDERTSPCDLEGFWFDEPRVKAMTDKLRRKLNDGKRRRQQMRDTELIAEGREACNLWARTDGFVDFAAAQRAGRNWSDVVASFRGPLRVKGFSTISTAAALGATAREWSAEEMAAGRAELGLP